MHSSESVPARCPGPDPNAENTSNSEHGLDSMLDQEPVATIEINKEIPDMLRRSLQPILSKHVSFTAAAPELLDALMASLEFDVALLWQPSADGVELFCTCQRSRSGQEFTEFCAHASRLSLWPAEGLAGRVWASSAGALIEEMAEDGHSGRAALAAKHGFRYVVGFPILDGNAMQYIVELFSRESHKEDRNILGPLSLLGAEVQYLVGRSQSPGGYITVGSSQAGISQAESRL
jgi:hypothetical protein